MTTLICGVMNEMKQAGEDSVAQAQIVNRLVQILEV